MHFVLFVPMGGAFEGIEKVLAKAFPKANIIVPAPTFVDDDPLPERVGEALQERRARLILVNPTATPGALREVDDVFTNVGGEKALPKAVFFTPAKKEQEGFAEYTTEVRLARGHFAARKRSRNFSDPHPKAAVKAIRIASRSRFSKRLRIAVPLLLVVAAALGGLYVARDFLLKRVLIGQTQGFFHAKAEAASLVTTFTPAVQIRGFRVADRKKPMQNLFEFENLSADIDLLTLVRGRFHAKELALEGLKFGTPRKESGVLEGAEAAPEEEALESSGLGVQLEAVIEGLKKKLEPPDPESFATVKRARHIAEESRKRSDALTARVKAFDVEKRAKGTGEDLQGLFRSPLPPTIADAKLSLANLKSLKFGEEEIASLRQGVENLAKDVFAEEKAELKAIRTDLENVKDTADRAVDAVNRAKKIKKVTLLDAPKIKELLEDFDNLLRALPEATKTLETAAKRLETVGGKIAEKKTLLDGEGAGAEASLEKARSAIEESAPELAKAYESFAGLARDAREDLEKEKKAVLRTFAGLEEDLRTWTTEAEGLTRTLEGDLAYLKGEVEKLPEDLEKDKQALVKRYGLDAFDGLALLKPLVGEPLVEWVSDGYRAYLRFRPLFEGGTDSEKPPKEGAEGPGAPAPAVRKISRPRVWIEKIRFQGEFPVKGDVLKMKGEISDLATDVRFTRKPVRITYEAGKGKRAVSGTIEYNPEGRLTIHVEARGFEVHGLKFRGKYLPASVEADSLATTLDLVIEETWIEAKLQIALDGVAFETDFDDIDPRIASVLTKVFQGIEKLSGEFKMAFNGGKLGAVSGETDLAEVVGKAFVDAFGVEASKVRDKAMKILQEATREPGKEARSSAEGYETREGASVAALRERLSTLSETLSGDGKKLEGKFETLIGELSPEADPKTLAESQGKELDLLGENLASARTKNGKDREEQEALLKELTGLLQGEKEKTGTAEKDLEGEIKRLKELLKKALPF